MNYLDNLCNNLNKHINKLKLTKTLICKLLDITRPTLDNWLKGKTVIDGISLYRLSIILNVSVEELFENENGINLKFLPFHENILDTQESRDMITINLNETSAEDVKAIMELRKMGFSDEQIQKMYDMSEKAKAEKNEVTENE